jgi:phage terminase large subunit-like protein
VPEPERRQFLLSLTEAEARQLLYDWQFWARPDQLAPPGGWRTWLLRAGRGFGKTRSGAEWVRGLAESGRYGRIALVGATGFDVRHTMVEGESGILAVSPPWFRPRYQPSRSRLVWPNGVLATTYSADEPARLRGPQHHASWCDELASWRYAEAWDNLQFGLRLGDDPRSLVSTTPKRTKLFRELAALPLTVQTRGSTKDNAGNLPPAFLAEIVSRYEGTTLGRQELEGELLDDNPAAMWKREEMISRYRVFTPPAFRRVVVGVDPSGSSTGDEAGIVAGGLGVNGHAYIVDDRSLRGSPVEWAREAVAAYHRHRADVVAAEVNYGGGMVEATLRTVDPSVRYRAVVATRGKRVRAEPVAALYEQGKVHHVGTFAGLEDELCNWVEGEPSPGRLDALVWCVTELLVKEQKELVIY